MKFKDLKKSGKKVLKAHYAVLLILCFIASFIGAEFADSSASTGTQTTATQESELAQTQIAGVDVNKEAMEEALSTGPLSHFGATKALENIFGTSGTDTDSQPQKVGRGVFAGIIDSVSSGAVITKVFTAINSVVKSQDATLDALVILSLMLSLAFTYFVRKTYTVAMRRVFLESRLYKTVQVQRIMYLLRVKQLVHVTWVMFVKSIYFLLWSLTIVGGFIKYYSYAAVPYILAENPKIKANDAITLSRKMMNGHKWECFLFDFSFIGWNILGYITFGLVDLFYANMYKTAAKCEYFTYIRDLAKENGIENIDMLSDTYLYEVPTEDIIKEKYSDIIEIMNTPEVEAAKPHGVLGFIANVFGIVLFETPEEKAYDEYVTKKMLVRDREKEVTLEKYPSRLATVSEKEGKKRVENVHYLRRYSIWSLIAMFFAFSIIGWIWEVSLHLVTEGTFVNRGTMHGPWLSIYGSGALLILTVLYKFRDRPALTMILTIILCGIVEYFTSYYLEIRHGERWWDYSGYFLNLNGRICAEGLLTFAAGGMAMVYALAPLFDKYISRISKKILVPLCIALIIAFSADAAYSSKHPNSGHGINDYTSTAAVIELWSKTA